MIKNKNFIYKLILPCLFVSFHLINCKTESSTQPSNQEGITMISIPAGTFTMGSPTNESGRGNDEKQYQVTLSAFKMSKNEITNEQFASFLNSKKIDSTGLYTGGKYPTRSLISESNGSFDMGLHYNSNKWVPVGGYENYPVINVSWYGADEFAAYKGGRLPTEAEWEYACRSNTVSTFNTGSCLSNTQANYDWSKPATGCTNTNKVFPGRPQSVGSYPANTYGLNDMHGNLSEWCSDIYGSYPTAPQTNPTGATSGSLRVYRGGNWGSIATNSRSAYRNNEFPERGDYFRGFRIVIP